METTRVAIDTDVVVDYLRRGPGALDIALDRFACILTAMTVYELYAVRAPQRQQTVLSQLMSIVEVIPLGGDAARTSSDIWRALATEGQLIGLPDILTAGICLYHDLPLLTRNVAHYSRVAGLKLITPDDLRA